MQINTAIIQNCLNIFLSQGLKVSMDSVANELGMSKRTLYELFDNKTGLVYQCVSFFVEQENDKMDHYLAGENISVFEKLFPILNVDIFNRVKDYHRFSLEIKRFYPDIFEKIIATHIESYRTRIGNTIIKGIQEGVFRSDINVEIVKMFFFDLLMLSRFCKEDYQHYSIAEVLDNTLFCFVRGIATPKGLQTINTLTEKEVYRFLKTNLKNINKNETI
ncbi:MAG: TetR/AcrR family transcriptional regulator [Bacteroidales bacterium]|jgi:AcrR family transcriptional regulator|nr:TetR/AcrR family transcriptional regulator [Bacteroidales bacterium]